MYVYIRSGHELYTVGFYDPKGNWISESDHRSSEDAAKRVAWLNGNRSDMVIITRETWEHLLDVKSQMISGVKSNEQRR